MKERILFENLTSEMNDFSEMAMFISILTISILTITINIIF
jgi:hypothetical protein